MTEKMKSLRYETKATDVTEKGIVTVGVNGIGIEDSQHDISMQGSFVDTLRDDITKMRWFLNHDSRQLLGVPLSGEEKADNVIMVGKINTDKQIGRDTLADYKLFAENGRTLEHSIGVRAVRRDEVDPRKVLQWKMLEYSTLTGWGANPNTYLVGIKSGTAEQIKDAVDLIRQAFKQRGYSDERLKSYDMELDLLLKSLNGGAIVTCPCCGCQFDYDSYPEQTFTSVVRDAALDWLRWNGRRMAESEMEKLAPEVRQQVVAIIDSMKGKKEDLTEKSITDALSFVRCPNCYSKVYRSNALLIQANAGDGTTPKEEPDDATKKEASDGGTIEKSEEQHPSQSFWEQLNANIS